MERPVQKLSPIGGDAENLDSKFELLKAILPPKKEKSCLHNLNEIGIHTPHIFLKDLHGDSSGMAHYIKTKGR